MLDKIIYTPVAHSNGRRMITDNQLNISWTVAAENARLNWFLSPI